MFGGNTTTGIILIVIFACVVITSFVWLIILCYTRRHPEEALSTNTGKYACLLLQLIFSAFMWYQFKLYITLDFPFFHFIFLKTESIHYNKYFLHLLDCPSYGTDVSPIDSYDSTDDSIRKGQSSHSIHSCVDNDMNVVHGKCCFISLSLTNISIFHKDFNFYVFQIFQLCGLFVIILITLALPRPQTCRFTHNIIQGEMQITYKLLEDTFWTIKSNNRIWGKLIFVCPPPIFFMGSDLRMDFVFSNTLKFSTCNDGASLSHRWRNII